MHLQVATNGERVPDILLAQSIRFRTSISKVWQTDPDVTLSVGTPAAVDFEVGKNVDPIAKLGNSGPRNRGRIFWPPTGPVSLDIANACKPR